MERAAEVLRGRPGRAAGVAVVARRHLLADSSERLQRWPVRPGRQSTAKSWPSTRSSPTTPPGVTGRLTTSPSRTARTRWNEVDVIGRRRSSVRGRRTHADSDSGGREQAARDETHPTHRGRST